MSDKENWLANNFMKTITNFIEDHPVDFRNLEDPVLSQDDIWELSKTLAKMAQGRKSFAKFYNSPEGRIERKLNSK